MNEEKLREAIRSEIKKILNERSYLDRAKRTASTRLSALSKMQGFDRLKAILGSGSDDQRAAGLLQVIKSLAAGDTGVINKLKQRLNQQKVRGSLSKRDEV
tara:strand:+ start:2879 stop:3181 length:303 start_codon:yes stop_codon:yes gene_type:complete